MSTWNHNYLSNDFITIKSSLTIRLDYFPGIIIFHCFVVAQLFRSPCTVCPLAPVDWKSLLHHGVHCLTI